MKVYVVPAVPVVDTMLYTVIVFEEEDVVHDAEADRPVTVQVPLYTLKSEGKVITNL